MISKIIITIILLIISSFNLLSQEENIHSTLQIITSGGKIADSLFIKCLESTNKRIVFIPTAASSLRSETGIIWNPDSTKNRDSFTNEIQKRFNVKEVIILHTRDKKIANTKEFSLPLQNVDAVWISGGNPGRFMSAFRGTRFEKELIIFFNNGGIIAGESAGAIVQGSYTIRGNPNKPVLMVKGSEDGIGILKNIAINPHLSNQKRENELISIIDKYPKLTGLGIDDDTGMIIKDGIGEVFGKGRVAIYDNSKHADGWYFWLKPGDRFDFFRKLPMTNKF